MGKTLRGAPLVQSENNDSYCIDVLYKSLHEFHLPEDSCSVGEYAEETVCIERNGSAWIVYGGERGQKHDLKTHVNCRGACLDVISRVTESIDEENKISNFFDIELNKNRFPLPPVGTEKDEQKLHIVFH